MVLRSERYILGCNAPYSRKCAKRGLGCTRKRSTPRDLNTRRSPQTRPGSRGGLESEQDFTGSAIKRIHRKVHFGFFRTAKLGAQAAPSWADIVSAPRARPRHRLLTYLVRARLALINRSHLLTSATTLLPCSSAPWCPLGNSNNGVVAHLTAAQVRAISVALHHLELSPCGELMMASVASCRDQGSTGNPYRPRPDAAVKIADTHQVETYGVRPCLCVMCIRRNHTPNERNHAMSIKSRLRQHWLGSKTLVLCLCLASTSLTLIQSRNAIFITSFRHPEFRKPPAPSSAIASCFVPASDRERSAAIGLRSERPRHSWAQCPYSNYRFQIVGWIEYLLMGQLK